MKEKKLSSINSQRLAALRFPLIVLVIYIHARSGTLTFNDQVISVQSNFVDTIKRGLSDGVARTAVPLFFLLSGYLLYFGKYHWSWKEFSQKIRRRIDTLFIPYLFWNVTLFVLLIVAQNSSLRVFFNSSRILSELNWYQQIRLIFGFQQYPIAYQFWFIRDLIVLTLISPAFFLLSKQKIILAISISLLCFCWLTNFWQISIPSVESILFFVIGLALGQRGFDLFNVPPVLPVSLVYTFLLTAFLLTHGTPIELFLQRVLIALGIVLALAIVRDLPTTPLDSLASLAGVSFFVFAVHEPLTTILLKIAYRIFPVSSAMALAVYLLVPIIVVLITIALYRIANTLAPTITRRVTGR